jgi:hypothetical protein
MADRDESLKLERIGILEARVNSLGIELDRRLAETVRATAIALSAAEKTTQIAQTTADRAVARAEAAASREYLEAQIQALRDSLIERTTAQKQAIDAAVVATKDALTSALAASERAISKAEEATEKRFESVNEFRAQLADQTRTFATKAEADYRFSGFEKTLDQDHLWQRRIELKFGDYATVSQMERSRSEITEWRRTVDSALTAASSKSGLLYAVFAMAIASGGLLIALFNLFSKPHV